MSIVGTVCLSSCSTITKLVTACLVNIDKCCTCIPGYCLSLGAWIVTGGTNAGVMEFVGEAVKDHMLSMGSSECNVVALGIATWGVIDNRKSLMGTEVSISNHILSALRYLQQKIGKINDLLLFMSFVHYVTILNKLLIYSTL